MGTPLANVEQVFGALADPTRRGVVERLGLGPASVSELATPFAMTLPSFVEHLAVLESRGLVTSHKEGRVRTYALLPAPLEHAEHWMARQRHTWEQRLDRLDRYLLDLGAEQR